MLQGELQAVLGDTRHPVNCVSLNSAGLLAVGDCAGGLRLYEVTSPGPAPLLVATIDLAALWPAAADSGAEDAARPGCDILHLELRDTVTLGPETEDAEAAQLPSLVTARTRVTDQIRAASQLCLVATALGCAVVDLRTRRLLEVVLFSQLAPDPALASPLSALASRAAVAASSSSPGGLVCVHQTSLDSRVRAVQLEAGGGGGGGGGAGGGDTEAGGSDTDSGCCVVSLEDGEEGGLDTEAAVTTIPREEIVRGSVLDLNPRPGERSKQSLAIMRKGSLPLEKMRANMRLFSGLASARPVKSSGYGREQPRARMFVPSVTSKPRPRKNNLFRDQSSSEPDLSADTRPASAAGEARPRDQRQRWSLGQYRAASIIYTL